MRNTKCAIAAQNQQGIKLEMLDTLDYFIGDINGHFLASADHFAGIGISAIGCPQNRATARQDSAHILERQRDDPLLFNEPIIAVTNTDYFISILMDRSLDCGTNDCIESRSIATACENADSLYYVLS